MSIPLWTLLGFAVWTLLVLMTGVGIRRWSQILTGRAALTSFPADTAHGSAGYRRAMRAHANCVENLPVYGAIVLCASLAGVTAPSLDALAVIVLGARLVQTSIHTLLPETNTTVGFRFGFFLTQVIAMLWMAALVVVNGAASAPHLLR